MEVATADLIDQQLAAFRPAEAHRLTPRQTEALRQRIVAERPSDAFDWWWRLLDPVASERLDRIAMVCQLAEDVFESRQASTARECQSMIATR